MGGAGAGLHLLAASQNGHVYVIEGASGCVNKIDLGERVLSMVLADDLNGDGTLDLIIGTMSGEVNEQASPRCLGVGGEAGEELEPRFVFDVSNDPCFALSFSPTNCSRLPFEGGGSVNQPPVPSVKLLDLSIARAIERFRARQPSGARRTQLTTQCEVVRK